MKANNESANHTSKVNLEHVIEPLASLICAADQPKLAFNSALVMLANAVRETNRTARAHVRAVSQVRC